MNKDTPPNIGTPLTTRQTPTVIGKLKATRIDRGTPTLPTNVDDRLDTLSAKVDNILDILRTGNAQVSTQVEPID